MSNIFNVKEPKNITVELDADSLVYRIGGMIDMMGEGRRFAERTLEDVISNIYEDTAARKVNIYLGTETNYRKDIASISTYKGNRKERERPQFYDAIRAWLVSKYDARLVYDQEAEDQVGIAACSYKHYNNYIIGAIDKDMKMIAGNHYNYVTRKIEFIDEIQALRNFYTQLIQGDTTDNIPGLYKLLLHNGLDEVAHKLRYSKLELNGKKVGYMSYVKSKLNECKCEKSMYDFADKFYSRYMFNKYEDDLLEIARLLWIRREENEMFVFPPNRVWVYPKLRGKNEK